MTIEDAQEAVKKALMDEIGFSEEDALKMVEIIKDYALRLSVQTAIEGV